MRPRTPAPASEYRLRVAGFHQARRIRIGSATQPQQTPTWPGRLSQRPLQIVRHYRHYPVPFVKFCKNAVIWPELVSLAREIIENVAQKVDVAFLEWQPRPDIAYGQAKPRMVGDAAMPASLFERGEEVLPRRAALAVGHFDSGHLAVNARSQSKR